MKRKSIPSESFSSSDAREKMLPHLQFIAVDSSDNTYFSILLARVPCVGEIVVNEGIEYKVLRVEHWAVTPSGKVRCGYNARLEVEPIPDEQPLRRRGSRKTPPRDRK
jgi:hypothetical protein